MFDCLKPKNGVRVRSPIYEHIWVCSMFKNWCSSSFEVWWNGIRPITSFSKQDKFKLLVKKLTLIFKSMSLLISFYRRYSRRLCWKAISNVTFSNRRSTFRIFFFFSNIEAGFHIKNFFLSSLSFSDNVCLCQVNRNWFYQKNILRKIWTFSTVMSEGEN